MHSSIKRKKIWIAGYDQIRMLDIDGYPKAYFENKKYKVTFRSANFVRSKIKCYALIENKSIR